MVLFVAKRLSEGGFSHQHIVRVWWEDTSNGKKGNMDTATAVKWLDTPGNQAYVSRGGRTIEVETVHPSDGRDPYLKTRPDNTKADNLLSLPDR